MDLKSLNVEILPQPNDVTCGPTSLHAVYSYYGDIIPLKQVIKEVKQFKNGGTLAVLLGTHALQRGYEATIYSYNLHMFDPSWFELKVEDLRNKLCEQSTKKTHRKFQFAANAYLQFLENGGNLRFEDLTPGLIQSHLKTGVPILTGLSATYLYQTMREIGETNTYDDVIGEPAGHFVVLSGYDRKRSIIRIADPLNPNPISDKVQYYEVNVHRVINSILLGIVTYDSNILIIKKK